MRYPVELKVENDIEAESFLISEVEKDTEDETDVLDVMIAGWIYYSAEWEGLNLPNEDTIACEEEGDIYKSTILSIFLIFQDVLGNL